MREKRTARKEDRQCGGGRGRREQIASDWDLKERWRCGVDLIGKGAQARSTHTEQKVESVGFIIIISSGLYKY